MTLQWINLLRIQRNLYAIPRGMARFREYLRVMIAENGKDLLLPPLVAMNPMAKDHVPALLDALLALDAESIGAGALAEATRRGADNVGDFRVALVVADDVQGGWTNRYACEFGQFAHLGTYRCDWLAVLLWASESLSERSVREAVLTHLYRLAHMHEHGQPATLREVMIQEGQAMARAGCTEPALDADDLEYTRAVILPFLETRDIRTMIECLFGDAAGRTLGFTPQGLSHRAGLALALADARRRDNILEPTYSFAGGSVS